MPFRLSDECLGVVKADPGRTRECVWGACGCFGVSRGVLGVLVPNIFNLKTSQSYGRFDLLESFGIGFRAELLKFTLLQFC